jgi:hypothetical protein
MMDGGRELSWWPAGLACLRVLVQTHEPGGHLPAWVHSVPRLSVSENNMVASSLLTASYQFIKRCKCNCIHHCWRTQEGRFKVTKAIRPHKNYFFYRTK